MLEDLFIPGLNVVFCGTAAGAVSAAKGQYYAGPGNKFWPTLHETGLTPRRLAPGQYRKLLEYGIGLTDIVKGQSGSDTQIDFKQSDAKGVLQKIHQFSPSLFVFNGKKAAQVFLNNRKVEFGLYPQRVGNTRLFIAPSTSGAANGFWNVSYWHHLAELVKTQT
jgi:TDG/mug DNA glycosylase family protein